MAVTENPFGYTQWIAAALQMLSAVTASNAAEEKSTWQMFELCFVSVRCFRYVVIHWEVWRRSICHSIANPLNRILSCQSAHPHLFPFSFFLSRWLLLSRQHWQRQSAEQPLAAPQTEKLCCKIIFSFKNISECLPVKMHDNEFLPFDSFSLGSCGWALFFLNVQFWCEGFSVLRDSAFRFSSNQIIANSFCTYHCVEIRFSNLILLQHIWTNLTFVCITNKMQ